MQKNLFLDYYGKNQISPVHQDLSDFDRHLERRRKLYRQCGIPVKLFEGAKVLEVGPGGGYNTLAFLKWGGCCDLVEANKTGISDIKNLFRERNIPEGSYSLYESRIEDYETEKRYDIVIAEGFLQHLPNQKEVIDKLKSLVNSNGLVVVTCADEVSVFVEAVKRLYAVVFAGNITDFSEKVKILCDVFEPQLKMLPGVSRPTKDWVEDNILNPVLVCGNYLSLWDAIELFGDGFKIIGSSPDMFCDWSWYKKDDSERLMEIKSQFIRKHQTLALAGMQEVEIDERDSEKIAESYKQMIRTIRDLEGGNGDFRILVSQAENALELIENNMSEEYRLVYRDIVSLVRDCENRKVEIYKYPYLNKSFGRGMQYIAFEKNE